MAAVIRLLPMALLVAASCASERKPMVDSTTATTAVTETGASLDTLLTWQSVSFHVVAHGNDLVIQPAGYRSDNGRVQLSLTAPVVRAEVGDLNADNWPELFVYLASDDAGRRGDVIGFSSNQDKSMSRVYFPPLTNDARASRGYAGHDDFAMVEGALVQRFPITANGMATSQTRQIQYKLVDGEAGRTLAIDKINEYQELPPLPAALGDFARRHGDTMMPEYRHALVDLDGDNRDDAVVILGGPPWCGSGGCQMLVLRGDADRFVLVSTTSVVNEPVRVLDVVTNGWKTLIAYSRGKGDVLMPFDGESYPPNASLLPKATAAQVAAGRILLQ